VRRLRSGSIELHVVEVLVVILISRLEARNNAAVHGAFPVTGDQIRQYAMQYFQAPGAEQLALFSNVVVHRPPDAAAGAEG
jgi:hypothetical protein